MKRTYGEKAGILEISPAHGAAPSSLVIAALCKRSCSLFVHYGERRLQMRTMHALRAMLGRLLLASLLIMGVMVFASPDAWGTSFPFHGRFSGTTITTPFSFTGGPGFLLTITGKSNHGAFHGQFVAEFESVGDPCTLRDGDSGNALKLVGKVIVLSFDKSGDQLFLTLRDSTVCQSLNLATLDSMTILDVSGGTGRYEGARGTMTETWRSMVLAAPSPPGSGLFGTMTGVLEGTIELAE
jgi:hypothetical protein